MDSLNNPIFCMEVLNCANDGVTIVDMTSPVLLIKLLKILHGGTLKFSKNEGKGATFIFTLPAIL